MVEIEKRTYMIQSDELRQQSLTLWKESIGLLNLVSDVVQFIPQDAPYRIQQRLRTISLNMPEYLAKVKNAHSPSELNTYYEKSIESILSTVSLLYIAQKWHFVSKRVYEQAYEQGYQLVQKIKGEIHPQAKAIKDNEEYQIQ